MSQMEDIPREQIQRMQIPDLYHTLAAYRSAFQQLELEVDRQRALLTGAAAAELENDTADNMAIIRTNYKIAQDETFADLRHQLRRLGGVCMRLSAEIKARGLQL